MDFLENNSNCCFTCNKSDCPLRNSQEYADDDLTFLEILEKLSGYRFEIPNETNFIPMICFKCQESAIIAHTFQQNCLLSIEALLNPAVPENSSKPEYEDDFIDDSSIIEYDDSEEYEGALFEQNEHIDDEHEIIEESVIQEEFQTELLKPKEKLRFERTADGRYKCLFCDSTFKTKDILRRHSIRHTKNKNFKCHLCPRDFFFQRDLKFHLKGHSQNQDKFYCEFCQNEYSSKSALTKHILIHEDVRLFECTVEECGKKFRTKFALNNHSLIHAKIKPFECKATGCSQRFTQKNILVRHMISSHKMNFYECQYCKAESFEKNKDLRSHWSVCEAFQNLR